MEKHGHGALFPSAFVAGSLSVLGVWFIGVYFWDRLSNFLVVSGLLVSSRKPHLITLPMTNTGMTWRTLIALVGAMFIVGGITTLFGRVGHVSRDIVDEIDRPSSAARESLPRPAPPMPMDPYGGSPFGPPGPSYGNGGDMPWGGPGQVF